MRLFMTLFHVGMTICTGGLWLIGLLIYRLGKR